ncbi:MAG: polysaccharide deacetylase family protein [Opitutaceae bacterium]|nr:polysaccharide deacetylase family protein [Opitutaceae bacterium]
MNGYVIKRNIVSLTGFLKWKWKHIPPGLYVLNFHRIGNPDTTPFDPNVFSGNEGQFAEHIKVITSRFRVISIRELLNIMDLSMTLSEPVAMITFDDGYVDNYSKSFPILKSFGATATFFLATNFIENQQIPWWDEAAWIVRNTRQDAILLPGLEKPINIKGSDIKLSIREVLRYFKDNEERTVDEKMVILKDVCNQEFNYNGSNPLFLNWDQVRELKNEGMDVGSHTCSHRILSHLSPEDQKREIKSSKSIIEKKIGSQIHAFAYPVGGLESFTTSTSSIVKESGYRVAFTFPLGGGYTRDPTLKLFEIPRLALEAHFNHVEVQYATVFARRH